MTRRVIQWNKRWQNEYNSCLRLQMKYNIQDSIQHDDGYLLSKYNSRFDRHLFSFPEMAFIRFQNIRFSLESASSVTKGASSRWSFPPDSAWGSIETTRESFENYPLELLESWLFASRPIWPCTKSWAQCSFQLRSIKISRKVFRRMSHYDYPKI